jgi:hypothetical protein
MEVTHDFDIRVLDCIELGNLAKNWNAQSAYSSQEACDMTMCKPNLIT